MDHDETGCEAPPEGPILCVNNCGFFGSSATMNLCSKCHKDAMLKQEQVKLAASSIGKLVNESSNSKGKELDASVAVSVDVQTNVVESKIIAAGDSISEAKTKEGPSRCNACRKRVGLTGFSCRCGNLFCSSHRYSDKHECTFDYHAAAQSAIAEANPVIKSEKLDKI